VSVTSSTPHRFKIELAYHGSAFYGWQLQKTERTVQGEMEAALERITGERRPVLGSGRTDRGVHATGQVAGIMLPDRWEANELLRALNAVLPRDIWVREVRRVPAGFHPRADAYRRSYTYYLGQAQESSSPFRRTTCWPILRALDAGLLAEAAAMLPGENSFRSFAKTGQEARGDRCLVYGASWAPWEGLGMLFQISANRYLHHMVRYLVGTMVDIGRGARSLNDMPVLLSGEPGTLETSPPAPPEGLFLTRVEYPAAADRTLDGDVALAPGVEPSPMRDSNPSNPSTENAKRL